MHDNDTDTIIEVSLKSFFRKNRYYDADELYNAISAKEKEFMNLLNTKQRIKFLQLRTMYERYADLSQQDSFSNGFFKGIGCGDTDA